MINGDGFAPLIPKYEEMTPEVLDGYKERLTSNNPSFLGMHIKYSQPQSCSSCGGQVYEQYNVKNIGYCCFYCTSRLALAGMINLLDAMETLFYYQPHEWEPDFSGAYKDSDEACGRCGVPANLHIKLPDPRTYVLTVRPGSFCMHWTAHGKCRIVAEHAVEPLSDMFPSDQEDKAWKDAQMKMLDQRERMKSAL